MSEICYRDNEKLSSLYGKDVKYNHIYFECKSGDLKFNPIRILEENGWELISFKENGYKSGKSQLSIYLRFVQKENLEDSTVMDLYNFWDEVSNIEGQIEAKYSSENDTIEHSLSVKIPRTPVERKDYRKKIFNNVISKLSELS